MFLEESSENWTQLKYGKNRNLKCFMSTTAFPMKLSIIVCLTILSLPIGNRLSESVSESVFIVQKIKLHILCYIKKRM